MPQPPQRHLTLFLQQRRVQLLTSSSYIGIYIKFNNSFKANCVCSSFHIFPGAEAYHSFKSNGRWSSLYAGISLLFSNSFDSNRRCRSLYTGS